MTKTRTSTLVAWAVYDWASSPYSSVILTFVFAAYFTRQVAPNEVLGTALWGNTIGFAGLIVALGGPIIGAIADRSGQRKRWLGVFTAICVASTALLWMVKPAVSFVWIALGLVAIGSVANEYAYIFYNAMLPALAPPSQLGRWSGWGWSSGYFGGTLCLVAALLILRLSENGVLALDSQLAEPVRAVFLFTALWYFVFSLPLFFKVPEVSTGKSLREAIAEGLQQLWNSIKHIRQYASIARFLLARMFYTDGLATLFALGGVYAAGTLQMTESEILVFGIALNIVAGIGAALFAWVDDWVGGKRTLLVSIGGLSVFGAAALLAPTQGWFWVWAMLLAIFVGPAQAASRSFLARIAPPSLQTELFGFFAFSGKATAFCGPLLVAWVTYATGSQRWGMATIVIFLALGAGLLATVPDNKRL